MLSINLSELILTVINFFLLYVLLKRFLYDPLIRFMDERQARIDAGRRLTSDALAQAQEAEARRALELAACREEARRTLAEARAADEAAESELLARLREDTRLAREESEERLRVLRAEETRRLPGTDRELAELLAARLCEENG